MEDGYVEYLERTASASVSSNALVRLAAALQTTTRSLAGGDAQRPPGFGEPGPHPVFEELSDGECEEYMNGGGIGRVVFVTERGPTALPVNFKYIDGDVVFRTESTSPLAKLDGETVSFEIDKIDDAMSEGWSVLTTGKAVLDDDPSAFESVEPWAGGPKPVLVRISSAMLTGRRIRQAD
jgi:nitroimidazol reductase NimA-like FMN-containing flavoprotein (pyridoxamine 5'-phosphate oxidase superfamily)